MDSSEPQTKVCLITGGTAGIGLATAKRFHAAGYHVVFCGRRADKLQQAVAEISEFGSAEATVVAIQGDVNDEATRHQLMSACTSQLGRIDVLVNNAGVAPLGPFDEIDETTFNSVLDTNIRSVFILTQLAWSAMKKHGGTIVNVSSLAAVDPFPGFSIYGASKAWLDLLTVALAAEGEEFGIRVCSVRPGAVETSLLRGLFPDFPAEDCVLPAEIADRIWDCVADPENSPSGKAFTVSK